MYSEKVTQAKIAFALRTGFLKTEPVFHTRSECDAAVSQLKSNWDEDSQTWKRELTREEIAFIKNERFLCRVSYNYWKTRYCWIKSREDKPIRYTPWVSQTILTDIFSEHEIEGIAIELQALKARQLGEYVCQNCLTNPWSETDGLIFTGLDPAVPRFPIIITDATEKPFVFYKRDLFAS